MYCRNCGKELTGTPEICLGCGAKPLSGKSYCSACGTETNAAAVICVKCGASLATRDEGGVSPKSRTAVVLLALFLGSLGVHRFYTGKIGSAVAMLVLFIVGWATVWFFIGFVPLTVVGIWALVDFIIAIAGNAKDKDGKLIENW